MSVYLNSLLAGIRPYSDVVIQNPLPATAVALFFLGVACSGPVVNITNTTNGRTTHYTSGSDALNTTGRIAMLASLCLGALWLAKHRSVR